jgi:hypothetical protein
MTIYFVTKRGTNEPVLTAFVSHRFAKLLRLTNQDIRQIHLELRLMPSQKVHRSRYQSHCKTIFLSGSMNQHIDHDVRFFYLPRY